MQKDHTKTIFLWISLLFPLVVFPQSHIDHVVVDKSDKQLYLMHAGKVVRSLHVVFGAEPEGHKQQQGDERTSEGNYTLDYKNSHSQFYRSIHISYPNSKDRANTRRLGVNPGGAIFIHGQKNGWEWLSFVSVYFNWTDGCIALKNSDMNEVWKSVKLGTPIEIRP